MKNGYDYYLEYQYRFAGDFYTLLFRTIQQADETNLGRLEMGFPSEVEAYKCWTRTGIKEFAKHASQDCIARKLFEAEYGVKIGERE